MVTRPLMDSIASITRPSWRNGVGSTHWLRQAKRTIMSGMGGCSSCRLDWGIHSLHGARSPCLMWVDDAVGLSHLRFGEGIVDIYVLYSYICRIFLGLENVFQRRLIFTSPSANGHRLHLFCASRIEKTPERP